MSDHIVSALIIMLFTTNLSLCTQVGPDPWDYEINAATSEIKDSIDNIPPDIKMFAMKKNNPQKNLGSGEWFFRRVLAVVLKSGQTKQNEDEVDISLQMKFNKEKWETLDRYIQSNSPLSEEMYRRSIGYIEDAIYKPTITEKISLAWSEYIQIYLTEYKLYITWSLALLASLVLLNWLWSRVSHRHIIIIGFALLYCYEVFVSFKEAEQQELDNFISAMNTCKWFFWTSSCEIPSPNPLVFLKHMNPLKIGIRMFTNIISEPMITISSTMKTIIHDITDDLWFPLNNIVYGLLIVIFNIILVFFLIMILFNYILNIPFNLSIFGLVRIGVAQRNRTLLSNSTNGPAHLDNVDRISGANLDKFLNVFSLAMTNNSRPQKAPSTLLHVTDSSKNNHFTLKRSASTGRLPNTCSSFECNSLSSRTNVRKRNLEFKAKRDGSGDT